MNYQDEILNLRSSCDLIELRAGKSRAVVAPSLQGRVLTSCFSPDLPGLGWINHELIKSGKNQPHINTFGGEDRIWLGPEAGQFGIFFKVGQPFNQLNWQTPACVDSETFDLVSHSEEKVHLRKRASIENYQGYVFEILLNRIIQISPNELSILENETGHSLACSFVGFESFNELENAGEKAWNLRTGLLNLWILGQYKCSTETWAIIPHRKNAPINTNYFAAELNNRLIQTPDFSLLKVDGLKKSKIGIKPEDDRGVIGSFDFEQNILTIVQYETDQNGRFLNSEWRIQEDPYRGDSLNVYNDGTDENGTILGPYYELESSSSSFELQPKESIYLKHKTLHFTGAFSELEKITQHYLSVNLSDLKNQIHGKQ